MVSALVDGQPGPTVGGGGTQRQLVARCLAITSGVAAVIHFAVSGSHFQEYWAFGAFMLVVAWLQLAWSVGMWVAPSRPLIAAGAVLNAGVVLVYVVTRTVGDVIGPTPDEVEPVGFGDAFCTVCEALVVLGCVALLLWALDRVVTRARRNTTLAAVVTVAVVLLSVALVHGGSEMVMSMDSEASTGAAAVSLPTQSPAGPVVMPDPDMQMEPGMEMAAGSACTSMPTTAQQAAAVDLVNTSWQHNKQYESLTAAKAAGFTPVTTSGQPVVHYVNNANYLLSLGGAPVIDPSAPQSLVYANTSHGAVLVAVMYIASPRNPATPDPGGCLTQWHTHSNLCFGAGLLVLGVIDPNEPDLPGRFGQPAQPAHAACLVRADPRWTHGRRRHRRPGGPGRTTTIRSPQRTRLTPRSSQLRPRSSTLRPWCWWDGNRHLHQRGASRSLRSGQPDQRAFGIFELADDEAPRRSGRTHGPGPAEFLRSLQSRLDVGYRNVEQRVALVCCAAADTAADARSVCRRHEVDETIVLRFGHLDGHRRRGIELPPEELAEELSEPGRVLSDDLEMNHWVRHETFLLVSVFWLRLPGELGHLDLRLPGYGQDH